MEWNSGIFQATESSRRKFNRTVLLKIIVEGKHEGLTGIQRHFNSSKSNYFNGNDLFVAGNECSDTQNNLHRMMSYCNISNNTPQHYFGTPSHRQGALIVILFVIIREATFICYLNLSYSKYQICSWCILILFSFIDALYLRQFLIYFSQFFRQ